MNTIIFLVEDDVFFADNLKLLLEFSGKYKVFHFVNGLDALAAAKENEPDIVISDIKMPDVNGFEFCEIFRKSGFYHIPFLFLTCSYSFGDFRKGMNLGADDFLLKPVKLADLTKAIEIRLQKSAKMENRYLNATMGNTITLMR